MNTDIKTNLARVISQIQQLAEHHGKLANSIQLLAVSKTFPAEQIRLAYQSGQIAFGENYIDEALVKINTLSDLDIEWHYIGPIQSNKTRKIAENFQWVHSLASLKHAKRLSEQRPTSMPPLNVCIQVNVSGEDSKSGVNAQDAEILASDLQDLPGLLLHGIMGIPAQTTDINEQRQAFSTLASIYQQLKKTYGSIDTLSMGMSGDMEAAIAEGSTMVRIGTAIFGKRQNRKPEITNE
ncbi:MAG: YggS family pyridoxal phosphate-dependent enzyme [Gammaproteobacteria bacterium]|nr:YggS family pyridoxal phosphate-dependent enzyme [Gammaproteobacteria bacterium]